jgi:hypothetical protein
MQLSAEATDHDVMDDVKAEADATAVAAGREERIQSLTPHFETHSAAIVGEQDLHVVRRMHAA